ncbi:iron-siderophore ABC transporter substrate-binding protein [Paracoccus caeni]|uniref:Iron-siderophore ABC transporter substrate-binding protein n=1 Tax=Paracoccus caeni TaxID=657651 RepID=A0A934SEM4_9RHOB|nr:iron-siderophore ABC transporter substrate-binding protein [Paracoccus caeni]MBK4215965.1 iron-siderophore ABC transporter substrate-binding protein [Paracoccus caeni]
MRLFAGLVLGPILTVAAFPAFAESCDGRVFDDPMLVAAPLCLPDNPQRIVVTDPTYSLGMALELGLPVVAAPLTGMSDLDLKARAEAAGVADIGSLMEPSIEAVVAAQPDLILGSNMAESLYPMLSQIAPTALISQPEWRGYQRIIAQIGGREAEYEEQIAALDARIEEMKPRIPDTTVSIIRITPWDFQVYLDGPNAYAPFALLRDLGVKRSEYERFTGGEEMKRPDWEDLAGLDGDTLLYIVGGMNDSAESGRLDEVVGNPLWQMLPAAQADRVYPLDPGIWMEFSGIASAHRILDDVERLVIGE